MRKVKTHKGYVIALAKNGYYYLFLRDEWDQGAAFREPTWEAGSLQEALDWIG